MPPQTGSALSTAALSESAPRAIRFDHLPALRCFMEQHVFAVWDFMCLLKALQQQLAPSGSPWLPAEHPRFAGLINRLVMEEETDLLPADLGGPLELSHFQIYRRAMQEVGAETRPIDGFLQRVALEGLDAALGDGRIPESSRRFMRFTFTVINGGEVHRLAAAYAHGREQLVPHLFEGLQRQLPPQARILRWYLQRHIELDGDDHGPLAARMALELCGDSPQRLRQMAETADQALAQRRRFWDDIRESIKSVSDSDPDPEST